MIQQLGAANLVLYILSAVLVIVPVALALIILLGSPKQTDKGLKHS